jgi:hypothetical protein
MCIFVKINVMHINCIINWELYHEIKKPKKIKLDFKIKTAEEYMADLEFSRDQYTIMFFCDPIMQEAFYLHVYEKSYIINGKKYDSETLNFKEDWDLLMYAVERIEGMGYFSTIEKFKEVDTHRMWFNECATWAEFGSGARGETKKETIYEAVLDFCKTYITKNKDKIIENGGKL